MTKSKITELKSAVCAALDVIAKQEKTGREDAQALEKALRNIAAFWISPDFQKYKENYGKVALMAHRGKAGTMNPRMEIFRTALDYGNNLSLLVSRREFDSPEIFNYLAGLHTTATTMMEHEAEMDAAIAKLDPSQLR